MKKVLWILLIILVIIWFWAWYVYVFGHPSVQDSSQPSFINVILNLFQDPQNVPSQTRNGSLVGNIFQKPSPSPASWTLLITGDILPARVVNQKMVAKNDFFWPLVNITQILTGADVTLVNLESPLIGNCPVTNEGMIFCGDPRFAGALKTAGVDIVNLANNHTLNHGWGGLAETETYLWEAGIETTGFSSLNTRVLPRVLPQKNPQGDPFLGSSKPASPAQQLSNVTIEQPARNASASVAGGCNNDIHCSKLTIMNIKGMQIGFLGYNAVSQKVDRSIVEQEIRQADREVDVLIVSVHWGKEYVRDPQPDLGIAPDDPKELGKLFIDWGADVVVGNHPHWWQGMEMYPFDSAQGKIITNVSSDLLAERRDAPDGTSRSRSITLKPVFYALGNTIFDQEWSPETKEGFLAKLHFSGTEYIHKELEIFPIGIKNYGEAHLLEGERKNEIVSELLH